MGNLVKKKRNNKISPKVIAFWSIIGAITVALVVTLIVLFVQNYRLKDQDDIECVSGVEIFNQEEDKYYVLVYNFDSKEENVDEFEDFVLSYLTFLKKYGGEEYNGEVTALNLYGADTSLRDNNKIITSDESKENITGAYAITDSLSGSTSGLLRIYDGNLPILLIIEDGKVVDYKETQGTIQQFLNEIIKNYTGK